jgi:hypothetical protein
MIFGPEGIAKAVSGGTFRMFAEKDNVARKPALGGVSWPAAIKRQTPVSMATGASS